LHYLLTVTSEAVLFYDHILTFDDEINYIWKRPKRASAYWFFANRYVTFFGSALVTLALVVEAIYLGPVSDKCRMLYIFQEALLSLNQLVISILLMLRVYALYERSLRILLCILGVVVVVVGISMWVLVDQRNLHPEIGAGCQLVLSQETFIIDTGLGVSWIALMIYDTIIFGFILHIAWTTRNYFRTYGVKVPLVSIIIRDGQKFTPHTIICAYVTESQEPCTICGILSNLLLIFLSSVSVTLMSRLMLNLHQINDTGIYSSGTESSTEVQFAHSRRMIRAQPSSEQGV
ncbi:hypothetical protein BDQ17DRAFT_1263259, partial [Cyathus striatus]